MPPVISATNLNVTLGNHQILKNLSFAIDPGETAAIIGPNGAGKTTLLKALLKLIPYTGDINITTSNIGYVPQHLDFDRTIPITVSELLSIYQDHRDLETITDVLTSVDADHLSQSQLGSLSGGEFQRVIVALSLLTEPDILFLDEPTASIDIEGSHDIYTIIKKLQETRSLTVALVSHDIDVVYKYATQVLCINQSLVCHGHPTQALTTETLQQLYGDDHTLYHHHEKQSQ